MKCCSCAAAALIPVLALLAAGCVTPSVPGAMPGVPAFRDHIFTEDRELAGSITLSGECVVPRGVTLTLRPGTRLIFRREDRDGDGLGDSRLRVEGRLAAVGTPSEPVFFTSGGDAAGIRRPGDWDALLFNFSRGSELRYAVIEYSNYSLHAHFSEGIVARCLIRRNNEGCRMGNCNFILEENLVRGNVNKGFNFRDCINQVRRNEITANGNGIFIFEKDGGSVIAGNNIYGNERYNFRVDDFFRGEMTLEDNWWGSADEAVIRETIYDSRQDPEIGTVHLVPSAAPHRIFDTLPFPSEATDPGLH